MCFSCSIRRSFRCSVIELQVHHQVRVRPLRVCSAERARRGRQRAPSVWVPGCSVLTAGLQTARRQMRPLGLGKARTRFRRGQNADRLRRLRELHDWRTTADRRPLELSSSTTRDCLPDPAHFDPAHFIETQDHVWPARSRDPAGPRNYTEGCGDLIPISIFRAHRYPIVKLAIKKSDRKS
jgi:hypothetical protein